MSILTELGPERCLAAEFMRLSQQFDSRCVRGTRDEVQIIECPFGLPSFVSKGARRCSRLKLRLGTSTGYLPFLGTLSTLLSLCYCALLHAGGSAHV